MIAYYPPFDNDTKIGPTGEPGICFDLISDRNYDMKNKILKNCEDPLDVQDASTKRFVLDELLNLKRIIDSNDEIFSSFVKQTGEIIQSLDNDMKEHCLYAQEGHRFDEKDKRINNVKDPVSDKNAINKK